MINKLESEWEKKGMSQITSGILKVKRSLLLPENLYFIIIFAFFTIILYLVSRENYLLFHGIIELISIVIAFTIFILIWNTRRVIADTFFLFIGISFLFIGSIDLLHLLAYKGMGVFPGNNADLPTQLWIAARYFQSITFFIATVLIGKSLSKDRKYDVWIIFSACAAAFTILLMSIFVWHIFPDCFIEGKGLTAFKISSEYVISIILIATVGILVIKRRYLDSEVWYLLIFAQIFLIAGELAFTSYISVYGFMNMLGHLFKLIAFYLFYRAIVVVGLKRPYDLFFRELKQKERALITANKKLTLLSSITRHDINNQLTVLLGYLDLLEMKQIDPLLNPYLEKITSAAERIMTMIQFTKTYESIGVTAPVWQDIYTLIGTASDDVSLDKIKLVNDIPFGTTVFADQLIIKVFYNLMDNAVRYGGKISIIRFSVEKPDDDFIIVCEDDGNGIAEAEKVMIFDRGFGKNTGFGLFLTREILSITQITIEETGKPGLGARFEILVPKGVWQLRDNGNE